MLIHTQHLAPLNRAHIAAELAKLTSERLDAADIDRVYHAMIVHRASMYGAHRLDANETAILELQLEQMRARTADIEYPDFKARQLVPFTSEVDPGAESWAYSQWDRVGMAKIIANYADDIPKVATFAKKFTNAIETLALGYEWSWLDMRRTAKAGVPLRARKADAVRLGFEQRIEEIASIGIKETGATGLLNNTNVPAIAAAPPGTGSDATWAGGDKTAEEVVDDLHAMEDAVIVNTKGVRSPDTMVMPLEHFNFISKTPLTLGNTDPKNTILRVFLAKAKTIRNIEWWLPCATAYTGDTPMALAYRRDPIVVHLELPLEQEEQPPQAKGLAMEVNSVGRIGGVAWEYPLGGVRMHGI